MKRSKLGEKRVIESKIEVTTFLDRLKYLLQAGTALLYFQTHRKVDMDRDIKYSNRYTMSKLFPNEDEVEVLKRELARLTVHDYTETVKDQRYPNRSNMRVFGKRYLGKDVYVKVRVEVLNGYGGGTGHIFVMSFHFAEIGFCDCDFPYVKNRGEQGEGSEQ